MSSYLFALKNTELIDNTSGDNTWFFDDRGFVYADGFFDTMRFSGKVVPLWSYHRERIINSAKRLLFFFDEKQLYAFEAAVDQSYKLVQSKIAADFAHSTSDFIIKFIVTRGEKSVVTYPPEKPDVNIYVVTKKLENKTASANDVHLKISPLMLDDQPALAGIKQINRMHYTLAAKACALSDKELINTQVLFVDKQKNLVETMRHNIFLELNGDILTPHLNNVGVAGVFRKKLIDFYKSNAAPGKKAKIKERSINLSDLQNASSVFITNAIDGLVPVTRISTPCEFYNSIPDGIKFFELEYIATIFNKSSTVEQIRQELSFESFLDA